ncbi:aspartic peptidase domain-containing protein [Mycena galericulata]|nr:aspartic peptidase domain-containing protein [Mycena galericulata]
MSQNTIHQVAFKTNVASAKDIQQRDCARAKHHLAGHQPYGPKKGHPKAGCGSSSSTTSSIPVNNNGESVCVTYIASVGVGSPATTYDLLIDTGSSNTWIKSDGDKQYNPTSTSKDTRKPFQIQYGLGSCSGTEYTDQVTLGPKLVIKDQSIGVADKADQMNGIDGILGIGPVDLTQSTMSPDDSDPNGIATVTDNLLKQGTISTECIGICYEPTTTAEGPTGCLSFGGPDPSKYM